ARLTAHHNLSSVVRIPLGHAKCQQQAPNPTPPPAPETMAATPPAAAAAAAGGAHSVFVYGSLMADEVVSAILKRIPASSPALLAN
uniref:Uncharacterized protein n=1 Tax=Aegilops tauschii subsp. strangulata TaxID=200361 RepID=A0A453SMZ2_AEGTS